MISETSTIPYHQWIDENSQLQRPLPAFAQNLGTLIHLYHQMQELRLFDQKAIALQRTGKLATYPAATGQEAVCIGVGHAMEKTDVLCPYYRDQGTLLQRSVSMGELLAYWGGDERGNRFKNNPHDLPIAVPIASQCLHAAGVAYAFWQRKQPYAVVATLGDGGTSKGDFYEAINLAGVWQLPIVFVINNNQWAISVSRQAQTAAKTLAQKAIAAGIAATQVDGNDVIAVREVVAQALAAARAGKGATVIEAITYRLCDHTTADDARRYTPTEEIKTAQAKEPIQRLRHYLTMQGHWSDQQETNLIHTLKSTIDAAAKNYLNRPKQLATAMFDHLYAHLPAALASQRASLATEHSPPVKQRAIKAPSAIPPCVYPMLNLVQAVNQALHDAMLEDSEVLILGQDVGKNGGVFRATVGLWEKFGPRRVLDTPLAESMIAGIAIGMATQGLKPVAEFQFMGFIYAGIDHILSHAARMRHRTRGRLSCPLVYRAPYGGGIHAPEHHSESMEALFAHIPGLRVVIPSSPAKAYALLRAAIQNPDPVLFLEPKRLYRLIKEDVVTDTPAPLDRCFILQEGSDITLISWGAMLYETQQAADILAEEGIFAEIIDVATIKPLDIETILHSVRKTGRCVIIHEAPGYCGVGAEICAQISEQALLSLLAPVQRVTGYDTVMPYAQLEKHYLPSVTRILEGIRRALDFQ